MRLPVYWLVGLLSAWAASTLWALPPSVPAAVEESTASLEEPSMEQPSSAEESEATDVIPPNAEILASSQPVTPISTLQHKSPHEEARDELIQALALWNNDHAEAASDMALEAYDDLSQLRRVPNMKRSQIRAEIRQAAELYIEASIKTIDNFVAKTGHSPEALQEAKERLEDLRDVARDYKKLTLMLNNAIEQLTTAPPAHPGS